jgi:hypothetical protein
MKKSKLKLIYFAAGLLALLVPLRAERPSHGEMKAEDDMLVTMTAKVQAVDLEKRELTLKGPLGDVADVTVDKAVERLDEIKPGDEVTAKYYLSMAAELREPTAQEKEKPITIVEAETRAPKTDAPAAKSLRLIKVVATVEGLQRPTRLVTLKGPRGKFLTVKAKDVDRMEKLHLGDTIVVTFTEALAVSVQKEKDKAK